LIQTFDITIKQNVIRN